MEEEIVETGSSLDENEEESDKQEEEEWSSYPSLPSNESNALTHTLFDCPPFLQKENECYDPIDSFETSLFDKNDLVIYDIRAILIYLMIILYLLQPLRCMIMKSCA